MLFLTFAVVLTKNCKQTLVWLSLCPVCLKKLGKNGKMMQNAKYFHLVSMVQSVFTWRNSLEAAHNNNSCTSSYKNTFSYIWGTDFLKPKPHSLESPLYCDTYRHYREYSLSDILSIPGVKFPFHSIAPMKRSEHKGHMQNSKPEAGRHSVTCSKAPQQNRCWWQQKEINSAEEKNLLLLLLEWLSGSHTHLIFCHTY